MDFAILVDQRENQRKEKEIQVLGPCPRTKKNMEYKIDGNTKCNSHAWNSFQRLGKQAGGVGNWRMSQDHPSNSIAKIGQNIKKKSLGGLKRLVPQTPEENQQ